MTSRTSSLVCASYRCRGSFGPTFLQQATTYWASVFRIGSSVAGSALGRQWLGGRLGVGAALLAACSSISACSFGGGLAFF